MRLLFVRSCSGQTARWWCCLNSAWTKSKTHERSSIEGKKKRGFYIWCEEVPKPTDRNGSESVSWVQRTRPVPPWAIRSAHSKASPFGTTVFFKMLVGSVSSWPPPGPRSPSPLSRTALTDEQWHLRYWAVSKVHIFCGPAVSMEAKRSHQAASAQIFLSFFPIFKCTGILPLGYFFFFLKKKTQHEVRLHSNPHHHHLHSRDRVCAESMQISTERSYCRLCGLAKARAWFVGVGRKKKGLRWVVVGFWAWHSFWTQLAAARAIRSSKALSWSLLWTSSTSLMASRSNPISPNLDISSKNCKACERGNRSDCMFDVKSLTKQKDGTLQYTIAACEEL